jgi:hypothetical protein
VSAEAEGVPGSAEKVALSLFGLLEPIATSSNSRAINTNNNFSRARNTYPPNPASKPHSQQMHQ